MSEKNAKAARSGKPKKVEMAKVPEEEVEEKMPEFREFCLTMIRSELGRIPYTIQRLKQIRAEYNKLKNRLIMRPQDEDSVIDTMSLNEEFFDEYEKFCDKWTKQKELTKKAAEMKAKVEKEAQTKIEKEMKSKPKSKKEVISETNQAQSS